MRMRKIPSIASAALAPAAVTGSTKQIDDSTAAIKKIG